MFYQEAKTARSAVVGTIMPWTGGLTNIPPGWILCDGGVVDAAGGKVIFYTRVAIWRTNHR